MIKTSFTCSCCTVPKSYSTKRALRKHQQVYDPNFVYGGDQTGRGQDEKKRQYESTGRKCEQCSLAIPYEKYINNRKVRFCSLSCKSKAINNVLGKYLRASDPEKPSLKRIDGRRVYTHDRMCKHCNVPLDGSALDYCNNKCKSALRRKQQIDSWLSGDIASAINSDGSLKSSVRDWLLETAGNKCEECSWSKVHPVTGRVPLQIDHQDGDHTNNVRSNLKVLCPSCHAMTPNYGSLNRGKGRESRREYRQALRAVLRADLKENAT